MKLELIKKSSDKLGTYYGIFMDEILVHYEFSRSSAEKVMSSLNDNTGLVILNKINNFRSPKYRKINSIKPKITEPKKQIATKKLSEKLIDKPKLNISTRKSKIDPFNPTELKKRYPSLSYTKICELSQLLRDMQDKGFSHSGDLSNYIRRQKLGRRYPNIAGIVIMANKSNTWKFEGGFPSEIYRIICKELGLTNKGTSARVIDFQPYKQLSSS